MPPRRRPSPQNLARSIIARKEPKLRAPRLKGSMERWLADTSPAALRKKLEVAKDGQA